MAPCSLATARPASTPPRSPRNQARDGGVFIDVIASGYGTEYENDCKPDCAQGHIHYYPALVVLWGSGSVSGHPAERRYTEVTLVYPGARPPVYKLVNGKLVATYPVTQTFPAL